MCLAPLMTQSTFDRGCSERASPTTVPLWTDGTYRMPVSGSTPAPFQSVPPTSPGTTSVPRVPPGRSSMSDGGVKNGPHT